MSGEPFHGSVQFGPSATVSTDSKKPTANSHSFLFCYLQKSLICFIFFKNILKKNWPTQQLWTLFITYSQFKNVFSTSFSATSMLAVCFKRLRGSSLGTSVIFAYLLLRYQDKNNLQQKGVFDIEEKKKVLCNIPSYPRNNSKFF